LSIFKVQSKTLSRIFIVALTEKSHMVRYRWKAAYIATLVFDFWLKLFYVKRFVYRNTVLMRNLLPVSVIPKPHSKYLLAA
jgi:hypothetical protein